MKLSLHFSLFCALCAGVVLDCNAEKTALNTQNVDQSQPKTPITQEIALATFDETWNTVEQSDVERDHGGVDWVAVKEELRPKAMNATSREELRAILQDMLSRLKRSHFGIIPADSAAALAKEDAPKHVDEKTSSESKDGASAAQSALEKFGRVASDKEKVASQESTNASADQSQTRNKLDNESQTEPCPTLPQSTVILLLLPPDDCLPPIIFQ